MKRIIALLLALAMCLAFCSCGKSDDDEKSSKKSKVTKQVEENDTTEKSTDRYEEPADKTPVIKLGEKVTSDKCEFTIDYIEITDDVIPPSPESWYSHYEAENGKVYVDFCIAYKNTDNANVGADDVISGKLIYSGNYEFTGFSIIEEDNRSDFTYSNITNITPLSTEYVHYLFEVPEEVQTSTSKIVLNMNIGGSDYKVVVREGSTGISENADSKPGKTSGVVALGEKVVTKNSEFNIDYAKITNDVVPPKPGDWYSHYEADSGKVYVDVCFAYKNTSGSKVGADDVITAAKLKYANKYDYTGFSMIEEDSRSDFTYSNITNIIPLSTEYVHYLFEVPEEVGNSNDSIVISFTIDGNNYTYEVR